MLPLGGCKLSETASAGNFPSDESDEEEIPRSSSCYLQDAPDLSFHRIGFVLGNTRRRQRKMKIIRVTSRSWQGIFQAVPNCGNWRFHSALRSVTAIFRNRSRCHPQSASTKAPIPLLQPEKSTHGQQFFEVLRRHAKRGNGTQNLTELAP